MVDSKVKALLALVLIIFPLVISGRAYAQFPVLLNDLCENRIPVDVPSITEGTTTGATSDDSFDMVCGTDIASLGVWYSVIGTGNTMTASTCGPLYDYDTKISVYCRDCEEPLCVDENDDDYWCEESSLSTVSWCSQAGVEYLILVHGYEGSYGDFELFISDDDTPCVPDVYCVPAGACCLPDGSCENNLIESDCEAAGGIYQGDNTRCEGVFVAYNPPEVCANAFEDISATGTLGPEGDDDGLKVPIGFLFIFYGDHHASIGMHTNGFLTFDFEDFPSAWASNNPIPNTNDPNDLIAPLWDDLNVDFSRNWFTYYETRGTAPNRRFIAQWTNVEQLNLSDSNTFQAILFEGTNCIEFRYGDFTPEELAGDYTIGIENQEGTVGIGIDAATVEPGDCLRFCPEFIDPIQCRQPGPPPPKWPLPTAVPILSPYGGLLFVLVLGVLGMGMVRLRKRKR